MEQVRASERRSGRDRRTTGTYLYTGPERRVLRYRRGLDLIACIYCKKVCDAHGGWGQTATGTAKTNECRAGICPDCSSERFSKFYSDN